jgi:hypothetical protein
MEIEAHISDDSKEKLNQLLARLEDTREKMELESHIFIEATKQFTLEWTQREIQNSILSLASESSSDNLAIDNEKLSQLKLSLNELPFQVPHIVESHLNREDQWIHRNEQLHAGISRDYIDFKKDKILKELTASVRLILGCSSEILGNLKDGKPEEIGWVKERGKRKYVCFLRFSDEMTASLNSYFEILERFFVLNHEIKEETSKIDEKRI